MSRAAFRICLLAIVLLAGSTGRGPFAGNRDADRLPFRIERDIQRMKFAGTDDVMALLAVRPGMTILDLGTGTGQFAYEFAGRLNGTGAVYATDTRAYCVDYVKKEARRRGLSNLHPVVVGTAGLDAFYGKHRYDLVAIFHVALAYEKDVDYLRELRGYLADDGRLALIAQKLPTPFSVEDFSGNFPALLGELSREPAGSPFVSSLAPATRGMIRDYAAGEPSDALKHAVVEDFNGAMRSGARFFGKFLNGPALADNVRFSPRERPFVDYLAMSLRNRGSARGNLFGPDSGNGAAATDGGTNDPPGMLFNKLLIVQRFRAHVSPGGLFASGVTPGVRAAFEKAGYRVAREYPDVIPFEDLVIFSAR